MKHLNKVLKILEHENLTSTQKIVLIGLEVTKASEGISFNELAFYTSLTRKTVITNLNKLETEGFIEVSRNGTKTNAYKVTL